MSDFNVRISRKKPLKVLIQNFREISYTYLAIDNDIFNFKTLEVCLEFSRNSREMTTFSLIGT